MALICEQNIQGTGLTLVEACEVIASLEIVETTRAIKAALNQVPADVELARVLISKRMGLRVALGERKAMRLRSPEEALRGQGRAGADAIALLAVS